MEFGLPIRLSGASTERTIGFPFRKLAEEEGVVFPDHFVFVRGGVGSRRDIERTVHDLQPGVTEVYVHPAVDTPELRALTADWAARVDDHDLVVTDRSLRTMLDGRAPASSATASCASSSEAGSRRASGGRHRALV